MMHYWPGFNQPAQRNPGQFEQPEESVITVVLSPHSDDACFSLGFMLHMNPGSILFNLYTSTDFTATGRIHPGDASRLRRTEDAAFAARLGLQIKDLALPEAMLRGYHPFDLRGIERDAVELDEALCPLLADIGAAAGPHRIDLFCPLGVGGHRDHVATLMVVIENLSALSEHFRVCFYEDLPYASYAESRETAASRLKAGLSPRQLVRQVLALNDSQFAEKLELARLYRSQFSALSDSVKLIPAETPAPMPHEAWWTLD